jgi:hypothetical protein
VTVDERRRSLLRAMSELVPSLSSVINGFVAGVDEHDHYRDWQPEVVDSPLFCTASVTK